MGRERVTPGVIQDCSGYGMGHTLCYRGLQWIGKGSCLVLPRSAVDREWVMPGVTEDCSGYRVGHAWCYRGLQWVWNGSYLVLPRDYSG